MGLQQRMRSTVHPNGEGKLRPVAISVRLKTLPPLGFIKSVRFPQITFFEEKKFQGRCYNCSSDCADLHTYFNRCSSIRVESGVWVIYEKPNYKGFQYVLSPGEYADNQQWMAFNDNVKSCRTVKNVSSPLFFPSSFNHKIQQRFHIDCFWKCVCAVPAGQHCTRAPVQAGCSLLSQQTKQIDNRKHNWQQLLAFS